MPYNNWRLSYPYNNSRIFAGQFADTRPLSLARILHPVDSLKSLVERTTAAGFLQQCVVPYIFIYCSCNRRAVFHPHTRVQSTYVTRARFPDGLRTGVFSSFGQVVYAIAPSMLLYRVVFFVQQPTRHPRPPTRPVQIPSMTAAFKSHGMDLRWQGWVASVYGIISFFVGPVGVRSTMEERDPFCVCVFCGPSFCCCFSSLVLRAWTGRVSMFQPPLNASCFIFNEGWLSNTVACSPSGYLAVLGDSSGGRSEHETVSLVAFST